VLLRRKGGDLPELDEYLGRFPDQSQALALQFAADRVLWSASAGEPAGAVTLQGRHTSAEAPEALGTIPVPKVDGYEIVGLLGRGGMGVVYKAREVDLDRLVALKLLAGGLESDPNQRERFLHEARAAARLKHPNIVPIHANFESEGRPCLALEFVDGRSLADRLKLDALAPRDAAELVETLARAVHFAHQAGIVHRDLKPSNVLLTAEGIPKLADFGLAKMLDIDSARTLSGEILGTPSFMAPEQAGGKSKEAGPTVDVYALGAILYQALTGRPPFLAASVLETLEQVRSTDPVPPRQLQPGLSRDLETICLKCLEKDPHRRYPSASAMAGDLRRFLDGRPIEARPVGPAELLWRWCRRRPLVAGLSATVAATLLISSIVSSAWARRAILAERTTRSERDRAAEQAAIAEAVNGFLNKDLLANASPLKQAETGAKPDRDIKLRTVLDRASETIGERFADQPLVEAAIRQTLGETYQQLGLYKEALPHLERSLELCRGRGPFEPSTFIAMNRLGALKLADGKLDEAKSLLVPAKDHLLETLGLDHPETLKAMTDLGQLDLSASRPDEAEPLFKHVFERRSALHGAEDIETLEAMHNLAVAYSGQAEQAQTSGDSERLKERLEQAGDLLDRAIRALESTVVFEHPYTLEAKMNLAVVYDLIGNDKKAADLFAEALEGQRKVLGGKHPDTLFTMVRFAYSRCMKFKFDEAEPLAREALDGCRLALDQNHEATGLSLVVLSVVYENWKQPERVAALLIESRDISLQRYGRDHAITASANHALGDFLLKQRQSAEAEPCLREALTWFQKNKSEDRERFGIEGLLGICLVNMKRYPDAREPLLSAYSGLKGAGNDPVAAQKDPLPRVIQAAAVAYHHSRPQRDVEFSVIRLERAFQEELLDLAFPVDPFGPD
jgi:serine/threonine protein kinase/tetratricopeptide (TPR) repeat protein